MKNPFNPQATAILKAFCTALALCNAADADGSNIPGKLANQGNAYGHAANGAKDVLSTLGFPGAEILSRAYEINDGDFFAAICDAVAGWESEAKMNAESAESVRDSVIENAHGYDSESDYIIALHVENAHLENCREIVRRIHDVLSAQAGGNKARLFWID